MTNSQTTDNAQRKPVDRQKLLLALDDSLNEGDLRDLCFELRLDFENLPGTVKKDKARELIIHFERIQQPEVLVNAFRKKRPLVDIFSDEIKESSSSKGDPIDEHSKASFKPTFTKFSTHPSSVISYRDKNHEFINGEFVVWEKCTILLWVLVPPEGTDLRNAPNNRYLLSHYTSNSENRDFNVFGLRYFETSGMWESNQWQVLYSNEKAQQLFVFLPDGLKHGWHRFMIAWDNVKPRLEFCIDDGKTWHVTSTSFYPFWPKSHARDVTIGAWVSPYDTGYCETRIYRLEIYPEFLEPSNPVAMNHLEEGIKYFSL